MAVVWHGTEIRQYCPRWKRDRGCTWDLAVKVSYILLHLFDLALTVLAVSLGLAELNPLMRDLLASPLQLIVIKLAIPLLIAWLVPSKLLIPGVLFLSLVIGWNAKELFLVLF